MHNGLRFPPEFGPLEIGPTDTCLLGTIALEGAAGDESALFGADADDTTLAAAFRALIGEPASQACLATRHSTCSCEQSYLAADRRQLVLDLDRAAGSVRRQVALARTPER